MKISSIVKGKGICTLFFENTGNVVLNRASQPCCFKTKAKRECKQTIEGDIMYSV